MYIKHTVKSHFKVLGFYNFIRGFEWAYKRGDLYPGGFISGVKKCSERRDKTYLRNELKPTYHYILIYIHNIFIVRHNKQRVYFKNIYKTDFYDCININAKGTHLYSRWKQGAYIRVGLYPE